VVMKLRYPSWDFKGEFKVSFGLNEDSKMTGGVMTKNLTKVFAALAVLVLGVVVVHAQERNTIGVDIPYSFTVQGKVMPAGHYTIEVWSSQAKEITLRSLDGKHTAFAAIATSLRPATMAPDAEVVFDVSGDSHILAEVWVPGLPGYLIEGYLPSAEAHIHATVKASGKTT